MSAIAAWQSAPELPWLWAGVAVYLVAAARVWIGGVAAAGLVGGTPGRDGSRELRGPWLEAGVTLIAIGLALRWSRLGHGPFLNMFEILASSLFSLGLIYAFACRRRSTGQAAGALVVLPVLALMGLWMLTTDPADTHFPPTYDTPVLWFHVLLGKIFLGCALVATGLAGVVLLRRSPAAPARLARGPSDLLLEQQAWRVMQVALVFETLMLVAGAVWAQDAWGRYWAWDPLETWAFLTWLLLVGAIHARRVWPIGPTAGAGLIVAVFVVAFLTFFGVPFISVAPHKGAV